jgi:hypothetical protein
MKSSAARYLAFTEARGVQYGEVHIRSQTTKRRLRVAI